MATILEQKLDEYNKINNKLQLVINTVNNKLDNDECIDVLLPKLIEAQSLSEKLVNCARKLPLVFSTPAIKKIVRDNIISLQKVSIDVNEESVHIKLPFLLNKKENGNPVFIKDTLYTALEEYFNKNDYVTFDEKMVIVFEHRYMKGYTSYRDHDNIDLNMLVDTMTCFFLRDDAPILLEHYYLTEIDKDDNETYIHLVKKKNFIDFLKKGSEMNERK